MNEDVDELYRRAAALEPGRPSEELRRRVLAHAAAVAAERPAEPRPTYGKPPAGTNPVRRTPAIFGVLAAATLAGLVILPQFFNPRPSTPRGTPSAAAAPSAASAPSAAAAPPVGAPAPSPVAPQPDAPPPEVNVRPALASPEPRNEAKASALAADAARVDLTESARAATGSDPAAPLRRAAEIGDVGELESLLRLSGDIDARDPGGRTALMLAALRGQTKSVDMLLSHGADPNASDGHGVTPLQAALRGHHSEAASALRRAGAR